MSRLPFSPSSQSTSGGSLRRLMLTVAVALTSVLALSGCANYRLGTGTPTALRSLYIAPVQDEALVPQATMLLTRELRLAFVRDGRVQVVASPEDADASLQVTLVDYGRIMTSAQPEDTGLARKFDLTLHAAITLTDAETQTPLIEQRTLSATRQIFTNVEGRATPGVQLPAEYQTLPLLAQQLADRTLHTVLDTW